MMSAALQSVDDETVRGMQGRELPLAPAVMHSVRMSGHVTVGFRLHSGWAVFVAVAGDGAALRVLDRGRMELLPPGQPRFVYHAAAELALPEAERLIESVRRTAGSTARTALANAIGNLKVTGACMVAEPALVPDELAAVLRSHPRIHAAEGALYAGALAWACDRLEIPAIAVRPRDVWIRAAAKAGMPEAGLKAAIDAVRQALGPPWTADHKIATAAALLRR